MKYRMTLEEIDDGEVVSSYTKTCDPDEDGDTRGAIGLLIENSIRAILYDGDHPDILMCAMRLLSGDDEDSRLMRFIGQCASDWWDLPKEIEIGQADYILNKLKEYPEKTGEE